MTGTKWARSTDEFHLRFPNPNPTPNPSQVGTDEFLGEALLGLEEYLDGARHSLKLARARPAQGQPHDSHGSPVTAYPLCPARGVGEGMMSYIGTKAKCTPAIAWLQSMVAAVVWLKYIRVSVKTGLLK